MCRCLIRLFSVVLTASLACDPSTAHVFSDTPGPRAIRLPNLFRMEALALPPLSSRRSIGSAEQNFENKLADLSPYERRVVNLIGDGLTTKEIAVRLRNTYSEIFDLQNSIRRTLGIRPRVMIRGWLVVHGLAKPAPKIAHQDGPTSERHQDRTIINRVIYLLQDYREFIGWTKADVAKAMGVPRTYINSVENLRRHPTIPVLIRIARTLGISLEFLMYLAHDVFQAPRPYLKALAGSPLAVEMAKRTYDYQGGAMQAIWEKELTSSELAAAHDDVWENPARYGLRLLEKNDPIILELVRHLKAALKPKAGSRAHILMRRWPKLREDIGFMIELLTITLWSGRQATAIYYSAGGPMFRAGSKNINAFTIEVPAEQRRLIYARDLVGLFHEIFEFDVLPRRGIASREVMHIITSAVEGIFGGERAQAGRWRNYSASVVVPEFSGQAMQADMLVAQNFARSARKFHQSIGVKFPARLYNPAYAQDLIEAMHDLSLRTPSTDFQIEPLEPSISNEALRLNSPPKGDEKAFTDWVREATPEMIGANLTAHYARLILEARTAGTFNNFLSFMNLFRNRWGFDRANLVAKYLRSKFKLPHFAPQKQSTRGDRELLDQLVSLKKAENRGGVITFTRFVKIRLDEFDETVMIAGEKFSALLEVGYLTKYVSGGWSKFRITQKAEELLQRRRSNRRAISA